MGAEQGKVEKPFNPNVVRLRKTADGKRVIMNLTLIAFTADVEEFLKGTRNTVRFKILPPMPRKTTEEPKSPQA